MIAPTDRGCVSLVRGGGSGNWISLSISKDILWVGMSFQGSDIVHKTVALDDNSTALLYNFGTNFDVVSIDGLILLGKGGSSGAVGTLQKWFNTNRAFKKRGPIQVSYGSKGLSVFVIDLKISGGDPQFNIQPFSITGLVASAA